MPVRLALPMHSMSAGLRENPAPCIIFVKKTAKIQGINPFMSVHLVAAVGQPTISNKWQPTWTSVFHQLGSLPCGCHDKGSHQRACSVSLFGRVQQRNHSRLAGPEQVHVCVSKLGISSHHRHIRENIADEVMKLNPWGKM